MSCSFGPTAQVITATSASAFLGQGWMADGGHSPDPQSSAPSMHHAAPQASDRPTHGKHLNLFPALIQL